MTNHQIDPQSLFGKVMLVFFWGGIAACFVAMIDAFFHIPTVVALWLAVFFNMFFVWLKNYVMQKFNTP